MKVFHIACAILSFLLIKPLIAMPTYQTTTLPMPTTLDEGDKQAFSEILGISFYKDSVNPNMFYYIPPMHIRQYSVGAASALVHTHNVAKFTQAELEIKNFHDFEKTETLKRLADIEKAYEKSNADLIEATQKLDNALEKNNPVTIKLWQDAFNRASTWYEARLKEYNDAKEAVNAGESLLFPGLARGYFDRVVSILASMGNPLDSSNILENQALKTAVNQKIADLAKSYGGYIGVNVYGGFTREQVEQITYFRKKYYPNLQVVLLPAEKLRVYPLTDHLGFSKENGSTEQKQGATPIFKEMQGSGDFLGASIIMDITLTGAAAFASHLSPFILPVGISADFKRTLEPAEAELECDFTNGFTVQGRSDVRDGAIIYDNDLTTDLTSKDANGGGCKLHIKKGDVKSAEFQALRELSHSLESLFFHRTVLSQEEKERYFKSVMDDVQNNRADKRGSRYEVYNRYYIDPYGRLIDLGIETVKKAADFYWHTNIQDVRNISSVKFKKSIKVEGYETIDRELPTDFCLVFNKQHGAYDRCTEEEKEMAKHAQQALLDAKNSPECKTATDAFDCGKKRDAAGTTVDRDVLPTKNDDQVVGSI